MKPSRVNPFLLVLFLFFCISTVGVLNAEMPEQFTSHPAVEDSLLVEFSSPEEAQKAQIKALSMPIGKTAAISSRWDDTNTNHLLMSETLKKNGWKGTYFLNSVNEDYAKNVVSKLAADGGSVGAHTINHPTLTQVVPNAMFYQILANRAMIEAQTDLCVSTFTFPNGMSSSMSEEEYTANLAGVFRRSGIVGMSEPKPVFDRLKMSPNEMVCCWLFNANDRDPQLSVFERGFTNGMAQKEAGGLDYCGPFLVLGVHSWQKQIHADGFERLSKILATQSGNPEFWYCNTNEYTAYRLAFLNSEFTQSVSGTQCQIQVKRPNPLVLGAAVELALQISPAPKSVSLLDCSGQKTELKVNADGQFTLPSKGQLPAKIGLANASTQFQSAKFPGLLFQTSADTEKNVLSGLLKNDSQTAVENPVFIFRMPLKWTDGFQTRTLEELCGKKSLAPGETAEWELPLGEKSSDSVHADFFFYFQTQLDFTLNGTANRLYSEAVVSQPDLDKASVRDTALFLGSNPGGSIKTEWLLACSKPGAELIPLGEKYFQTWRKTSTSKQNIDIFAQCFSTDNRGPDPAIIYALEFEVNADAPEECTFTTNRKSYLKGLYLNGESVDLQKFTAKPGRNRLLIHLQDYRTYSINGASFDLRTVSGKKAVFMKIQ